MKPSQQKVEDGLENMILLIKTSAHKPDQKVLRKSYIDTFERFYPTMKLDEHYLQAYNTFKIKESKSP